MSTLLKQIPNGKAQFWILDGRHRYAGAWAAGRTELRCDVVTPEGGRGLRVIPLRELQIDPDVQFDFGYSDIRARKYASEWSDRKCDPLIVVPIGNALSVAIRAELKAASDTSRRISALEHFKRNVLQGQLQDTEIQRTADETKWSITSGKSSQEGQAIAAVSALRSIHMRLGVDGLRRTLGFAARWRGDRGATGGDWLVAIARLVRDDYDQAMTPRSWEATNEVVPAVLIRRARGKAESTTTYSGGNSRQLGGELQIILAQEIRKALKLRPKPVKRLPGKGSAPQS